MVNHPISNEMMVLRLHREMTRWGIERKHLTRRAKANRISAVRVGQVLRGDPGWLKQWTPAILEEWLDMVRTSWNA